jgi:uncharacterized protein YcgI (DUF1989 family)
VTCQVSTRVSGGDGKGFLVKAGSEVTVAQIEGGQCCDLFVFDASSTEEYLSVGHTWVASLRMFPSIGQAFVTNRRRTILTLLEDTTNGHHDMLLAACDSARYEQLGHQDHRSCVANLINALAEFDLAEPTVPQPVNLFTNVAIGEDGTLEPRACEAGPGQGVRFRSERDVLLVVSACPQDLTPINGGILKDVLVTISNTDTPESTR